MFAIVHRDALVQKNYLVRVWCARAAAAWRVFQREVGEMAVIACVYGVFSQRGALSDSNRRGNGRQQTNAVEGLVSTLSCDELNNSVGRILVKDMKVIFFCFSALKRNKSVVFGEFNGGSIVLSQSRNDR